MKIIGVSTQLYVWSQMNDGKSLDVILSEIADSGYEGAETSLSVVAGKDNAREVQALFDKYSLKPSSFYSGGAFHEVESAKNAVKGIIAEAEFASQLGAPSITVNPNPIGREKTDDELKIQAEYLNKLGNGLKSSYGMSLFIHNHTPEIVSNAREFRSYCDLTDPQFVNLCIDVHWVYRGGVDPFKLTEEYGNRVRAMHIRNSKDGIWSEDFSDGDIDYRAYCKLLEKINYNGWVTVELAYEGKTNITKSLAENIKNSREYVRQVFGA